MLSSTLNRVKNKNMAMKVVIGQVRGTMSKVSRLLNLLTDLQVSAKVLIPLGSWGKTKSNLVLGISWLYNNVFLEQNITATTL